MLLHGIMTLEIFGFLRTFYFFCLEITHKLFSIAYGEIALVELVQFC